jgi:hypothetical protein
MIFFAALFANTSCKQPPVYYVQREASIQELGICLSYQSEVTVPYQIRNNFDEVLNRFIQKYNSENHTFRLTTCQNPQQMSLRLTVYQTKMVSPDRQAVGVAVSLLGFAAPFLLISAGSPIVVAFWYFPKDLSAVEHSLSPDIQAGLTPKALKYVSNPGFLRSQEKQVSKHTEAFERFLRYHVSEVEKAYLKSKNTPAGKPIR